MKLKDKIYDLLEKTGSYIHKYFKIYFVILILISFFEILMILNFFINKKSFNIRNVIYLTSYILLLSASIISAILLIIVKNKKNVNLILSIIMHIYCIFMVAWSTLISCADMYGGSYPIVYLTIIMTIGGIVAVSPVVFIVLILLSLPFILSFALINKEILSFASVGGLFNISVFIIMSIIVGLRLYYVTISEARYKESLKRSMDTDALTGLGNERSYFNYVSNICEKYAVVMMDLNYLKKTNDTYGHRYGCHLVVKTGEILPTIFPNSHLFHIGGDEFVGIIVKEDLVNLNELLNIFSSKLQQRVIDYEGVMLKLDVAIGVCVNNGEEYKITYANADKKMYENKALLKEKK